MKPMSVKELILKHSHARYLIVNTERVPRKAGDSSSLKDEALNIMIRKYA